MLELLIKNREWVFSGIGVFLLGAAITFLRWAARPKPKACEPRIEPDQLILQTVERDPNAPAFLFALPNGETVDPFKVERITVSGGDTISTVHYWINDYGAIAFQSKSKAVALRVAKELTDALNGARGYRIG